MSFDARTNSVTDFAAEITPRVIFGAHACDIKRGEPARPRVQGRPLSRPLLRRPAQRHAHRGDQLHALRDVLLPICGAPTRRVFGYDLFLQDIGGKYLVSISSVEAANILEAACNPRVATDEDRIEFRHATRRRQEAFNDAIPDIQDVAMLMDAFHKDPFWEELGGRCLSCTACSAVCPTCFCFDIQDTFDPSGEAGRRERVCGRVQLAPQFAQVAGGHNFRGDGRNRVRHRMYHKLNGFLANHDRMLCVGCGRCVKACKANINPIEVLEFFERKGMQDAQ